MMAGIVQSLLEMMNQETNLEKYIHNMRGYYDATGIYSIYRAIKSNDHKTLSIYVGDASTGKILSLAQPLKHVFVRLKASGLHVAGMSISIVANVYTVVDSIETSLQDVCEPLSSQFEVATPNLGHRHKHKKSSSRRQRYFVKSKKTREG